MDQNKQSQSPTKVSMSLDSSPPRIFLSPKRNSKKKRHHHDSPSQKKNIKRFRNNNDSNILLTSDGETFTSSIPDSIDDGETVHYERSFQEIEPEIKTFFNSESVFSDQRSNLESELKAQYYDTTYDTSIDSTMKGNSVNNLSYRSANKNTLTSRSKNKNQYKFESNFDEPAKNFPSYNANTLSTTMMQNNIRRLRRNKKQPQMHILTSSPPPSDIQTEEDRYNNARFTTSTSDFNLSSELYTEAGDNYDDEEDDDDDIFINDSIKKTSGNGFARAGSMLNSLNESLITEDNDKTPVFKKAKVRALDDKDFGNINSSFDDFESENEVDFKLDSFGRLSNAFSINNLTGRNLRVSGNSSPLVKTDHILIKSTSLNNNRKKKTIRKFNCFSRTNSLNEDTSSKAAKVAISSAIDDANPVLELSRMNLRSIPDEIEDLNNLVSVNLYDEIYRPDIKLYLSNNFLEEINPRLFNLKNLVVLSLRHNNISKIPGKIRNISKRLNYLQLSGNKINWVPNEILMLVNLQTLSLKPNPTLFSVSKYLNTGGKLKEVHYFEEESKILNSLKPRKEIKSPIENFGNSNVGFKRLVGQLKLNPNIQGSNVDMDSLKILENYKFKAPKLSDLCLRKLSTYKELTTSEIKLWHKHLSKPHFKLIKSMLVGLVEENFCYTCSKLIINSRNSAVLNFEEEEEIDYKPMHFNGPAGSILEFYDLIENNRLVPVIKEFCCVRCIERYLKQEYFNNENRNKRGYYLADYDSSSQTQEGLGSKSGNHEENSQNSLVANVNHENLDDTQLAFNENF